MAKSKRNRQRAAMDELKGLTNTEQAREDAMSGTRQQLKSAGRAALIFLVVAWLLALGFWSGLKSTIPFFVAGGLTLFVIVASVLIRRNLSKSEELGALLGGGDLSDEEKNERISKLSAKVEKGNSSAIITQAQILMQDEPKKALEVLKRANLDKGPKAVAMQIRGMRAMIHLNLGEVQDARSISDEIDLGKIPDQKARANIAGIVAESWSRSGNPIEGGDLLDKYNEEEFDDVKVQLLRARAFSCAHRNDLPGMKRRLKNLAEISPQLLAAFVGQKRVHPLLQKEARRKLEKSGLVPRQRIQAARR